MAGSVGGTPAHTTHSPGALRSNAGTIEVLILGSLTWHKANALDGFARNSLEMFQHRNQMPALRRSTFRTRTVPRIRNQQREESCWPLTNPMQNTPAIYCAGP